MEQSWKRKCNRSTCQRAKNRQEFVNFLAESNGENSCETNEQSACEVLGHLSLLGLRPPVVYQVFNDDVGWVKLKRMRENQIDTEEYLDDVTECIVRQHICDQRSREFVSPC